MLRLIKWEPEQVWSSTISGVFVVNQSEWAYLIKACAEERSVYLGEADGKHSEVEVDMILQDFQVLVEDEDFLEKLPKHICGYGPLGVLLDEDRFGR